MKVFHISAKRISSAVFAKLPCKFYVLKLLSVVLRFSIRKTNVQSVFLISDFKTSVYFHMLSRGILYLPSPRVRVSEIGAAYGADDINFSQGETVIDVGANIGEFGLYVKSRCALTNLISIEPEETARVCCNLNNYGGKDLTLDFAVWNQSGEFLWHHNVESASSSLIASKAGLSKTLMRTATLDDLIPLLDLDKVLLIKIDAEGGEQEVLMGGRSLLKMTHYVAVDVGPERGINGESTSQQCIDFLEGFGFTIKWQSGATDRQTILFQNSEYLTS